MPANLSIPAGVIILLSFVFISLVFLGLGIANIVVYGGCPVSNTLSSTSLGIGVSLTVFALIIAVYSIVIWMMDVKVEKSIKFSIILAGSCAILACIVIIFTGKNVFEISRTISEQLWTVQLATFCTIIGLVGLALLMGMIFLCF